MTAGRAALHHLAGPHHFRFDNSLAPALQVRSGDIVVFETLEAYGGKLSKSSTVDELIALPWDAVHCLTGPVRQCTASQGRAIMSSTVESLVSPPPYASRVSNTTMSPDRTSRAGARLLSNRKWCRPAR